MGYSPDLRFLIVTNGGQDVADAFMRVYGIGVELCVFGNNNYSITF